MPKNALYHHEELDELKSNYPLDSASYNWLNLIYHKAILLEAECANLMIWLRDFPQKAEKPECNKLAKNLYEASIAIY